MEQPIVKRAFDFKEQKIDPSLVDTSKLLFEKDKFKVSGDGVFYTLQGEGPTTGRPAVFLRLHTCNLQCSWCDTWYTWNKDTPQFWTESNDLTVDQIFFKILDTWKKGCKRVELTPRVVITGGEPMLQKDNIDLLWEKAKHFDWEIETNGTINPSAIMLREFQINCSPKLSNSNNIRELRYRPEIIKEINTANNSNFKFVVSDNTDLDEIEKDFIANGLIDPNKIILMPEGVTQEEITKHARSVAEYAKEKGYRLIMRLQTILWGTQRRV